jgi:CIC family chloride channel protein
MLLAGALFEVLLLWRGHYYVEGVGYATIMDVLSGTLASAWFLLVLAALKLTATCLTLGSGGSGGIFSPSLFMGATLGAAYAIALDAIFPGLALDPMLCALVGMTALVAGATGAALTAVVMIFEMTLDYTVILPLTLAAAVSYGVRRVLLAESIYTMKLARRGHEMPEALQANAHLVHHVADIAMGDVAVVDVASKPQALKLEAEGPSHFVIVRDGAVVGVLARDWAQSHRALLEDTALLDDVIRHDVVSVAPDTTVFDLIATMQRAHAGAAVVMAPPEPGGGHEQPNVLGVVTKEHLAEALAEGMELFED